MLKVVYIETDENYNNNAKSYPGIEKETTKAVNQLELSL